MAGDSESWNPVAMPLCAWPWLGAVENAGRESAGYGNAGQLVRSSSCTYDFKYNVYLIITFLSIYFTIIFRKFNKIIIYNNRLLLILLITVGD